MGRLTWKNPDGTWGLNHVDIKEVPRELYGAVCKLKDYEETGLMPEQIVEMDELYAEKCKEVAKLQKKLEAYRVPTAFDLDKVLEHLENARMKRENQLRECHDRDVQNYLRCKMSGIAEAIEIVKEALKADED